MVRHISKAILIASGLITGLATIAAISYFRRQPEGRQESNTINRLRRSRHIRRRRNNNTAEEEDRPVSLFKEWGDDENRNLLNLLHAISENQSRKGTSF